MAEINAPKKQILWKEILPYQLDGQLLVSFAAKYGFLYTLEVISFSKKESYEKIPFPRKISKRIDSLLFFQNKRGFSLIEILQKELSAIGFSVESSQEDFIHEKTGRLLDLPRLQISAIKPL